MRILHVEEKEEEEEDEDKLHGEEVGWLYWGLTPL